MVTRDSGDNVETRRTRPGPGRPADPALVERRKRQIIEAAYRVFAERGYHDTGITEIMQAAELGRGTFYLYFDNKREILDSVIDFTIEKILTVIGAGADTVHFDSSADLEDYLRGVASSLFQLLDENPTLSTVLLRNGMIDEAITARMLSLADTFSAVVRTYVERAMDAGIVDRSFGSAALAQALTGFAVGGLIRGINGDYPQEERTAYVDAAIALFRKTTPSATDA